MSAVIQTERKVGQAPTLPLFAQADLSRALIWNHGRAISAGEFLAEVQALALLLPQACHVVNLCEDRYRFLVSFCAAAVAGQTNLLPSSRAPQAIDEVMRAHAGCYALSDRALDPAPPRLFVLPVSGGNVENDTFTSTQIPQIAADQIVAIAFTSGSTGAPKA